jgi:NAD-dependent SIR2 family protein deacetylase
MKHQKCSRCKKEKPFSDFHNDKARKNGMARYCKPCKKDYDKHGNNPKLWDKYIVYYLPKHRYVGMTMNIKRRINQHTTKENRNVEGYRILLSTKSKRIAHLAETFLHIIGFDGFRY